MFRAQLVDLWDELLALTEQDPDYRFLMDGQTVVVEDYLAIRPEAEARLDRAVREGRIQIGPWYTLPDEFLVSAETLVRNLERGIGLGDAHGGAVRAGYLPDSFGHAAQMPQVYRQFGFTHAVVWRGVPAAIDRLAFIWAAPDGSEILTAYLATSYAHGVDLPTDPRALAARLEIALAGLAPFHPGADLLLMNGNDHVLPQRGLTAAASLASRHLNGTAVRLSRLDEYLARLETDGWPRWEGELRSSSRANVLMGTLSVRIPDKQLAFAASQALERRAEPLAVVSRIPATGFLTQAWTLALQNAAHDTACGSGIDAVADEARLRSRSILDIAEAVTGMARTRVLAACVPDGPNPVGDPRFLVWNPSPFSRRGLVAVRTDSAVPGTQDLGPDPERAPLRRVLAATGPLPGLGVGLVDLREAAMHIPQDSVRVTDASLENAEIDCRIDEDGTLSVRWKPAGTTFTGLHRLVDDGDAGDEYNFSPPPRQRSIDAPTAGPDVQRAQDGPLRGTLDLRLQYQIPAGLRPDRGGRSDELVNLPVMTRASLDAGSSQLDFEVELTNRARDHRLRVVFPLPFAVRESHADTPFHVSTRAVMPPRIAPGATEWELPTHPMRSFVAVDDGGQGVSLIADGLHEYEVLTEPTPALALTLLRAVGWLSRDDLAYRMGHAGPAVETPDAQVPGHHRFRYSLRFHREGWEQAGTWRAAEMTLLPMEVLGTVSASARFVDPGWSIELEPGSIQMTACSPMADGFALRLLNASDRPHEARVRLVPRPESVEQVTLGGTPCGAVRREGDAYRVGMRPWEIVTVRVRPGAD